MIARRARWLDLWAWSMALLLTASVGSIRAAATGSSSSTSAAPSSSSSPFIPFGSSPTRWTFGAQVGFGLEIDLPHNYSHVALLMAQPEVGFTLRQCDSSLPLLDRIQLVDEGIIGNAVHPGGYLFGNAALFRFDGKPHGREVPYLDLGAGILDTTLGNRIRELTGHLQFTPEAGVGFEHFFKPRRAVAFEIRYMHISNGGLREPNHGFNAMMISIGYRWRKRPDRIVASYTRGEHSGRRWWIF